MPISAVVPICELGPFSFSQLRRFPLIHELTQG
jgi:hypothetical protein